VDTATQETIAWHTHFWQAPERTIGWTAASSARIRRSHLQGFSTGKMDGNMLTITTTHLKNGGFAATGFRGVPMPP
jgi:hypothetical protein